MGAGFCQSRTALALRRNITGFSDIFSNGRRIYDNKRYCCRTFAMEGAMAFYFWKGLEKMKVAAAYIRVSTEEQTELSPDSQLREIRKYAGLHGLDLPEEYIYTDEGISGKHVEKRAGFNRMLLAARQKPKPFDVILLWKFSRFARNRQDSIVYKSMLRKQLGIDVVSITENLGDDKTSILIEALIEAMDEYYSVNLAEEVQRGMKEAITRGKPISSPPFGYRMEHGEFCPDPQTAPVVLLIFELFCGGESLPGIAEHLNRAGIQTTRAKPFTSRSVRYILANPTYLGKLRWKDGEQHEAVVLDGMHPPLISESLWKEAQQLLSLSFPKPSHARQPVASDSLLHGLLRCGSCGGALSYIPSNHGYQCCNYARGLCNTSHYLSEQKAGQLILNHLMELYAPLSFHYQPNASNSHFKALSAFFQQRDALQAKLKKAKQAYLSGIDTLEEYSRTKRQVEHQLALWEQQEPQRTHAPAPVLQSISFRSLLQSSLPVRIKNQLLTSFVERIVFDRQQQTLTLYYRLS